MCQHLSPRSYIILIIAVFLLLPDLKLEVLAELVGLNADDLLDVDQVKHFAFELLLIIITVLVNS